MIGGASKFESTQVSFWQFMSSSTLNNMLLFQGLCVGVGALMFSMVRKEKKQFVGIWIAALLLIGSIPFIAAETVNAELPESGDIYAFFRGASTKTRDYNTANFSASDVSIGGCGLDTCLLTGKHELIMSMFPGSMVTIDLVEEASYKPEVVKILVHDFHQRQGLVYDYSQYDYGIGIVEGNTVDDTEANAVDNWWKEAKFADNVNNYINCPWEVKDYRKLPNNLRSYHFSSDSSGQECGSWGNTGDFYSRQVIIPKEEGISFFYADSDTYNGGLFEVVYNGVSHFKSLEEMKNGFELKAGLELMMISHDIPSPKTVRMFCHHNNNTGFGKCFDYNYPSLGNPSQQGPGHFQSSRKLTKGVEFTNGNYFFGRTDWKEQILWFRDGGCDSKSAKMSFGSTTESRASEEKTYSVEEREYVQDLSNLNFKSIRSKNGLDVLKKIKELRKSGMINLEGVNRRFLMRGQGNFWVNEEQRNSDRMSKSERKPMADDGLSVFELFGIGSDEEKKKVMLEMAKSNRSLIAWIIFLILAAAAIVALTVGLVWADIKDNCCGINRFGYNDFKNIDSYARPINDTLGAYKPEIEWSGLENLGEPMNNYIVMRETEEVRARFTLTAVSSEIKINNDVVTIQSFEIKKCDAVMSGSTGSCDILYETVGAGGMVKMEATGMKLNNAVINMKAGQNMATIGVNSVSFAGSIVKICISGTEMCSTTTVTFVGKPDGSPGDTLDSGSPFGSPYMTMQEMFENKGFLTTFVLVCLVSGILGVLMLLTLGYLIKDYVRPNMQGVDMKSFSVALIFLFCMVSPADSLTVFATKNVTVAEVRNAGLSISGRNAAESWNTAVWSSGLYIFHNNDLLYLKRCSQKMQMTSFDGPGGKITGISTNVCTVPTTNTTVVPVEKFTSPIPYYIVSPRFMGTSGSYVHHTVMMTPHTGQRAVEDSFLFYAGPSAMTYFFEVKSGKWFTVDQFLSFKETTVDASRMSECTEVKWHRYASICVTNSTLDAKSMNKGLCYGCYGQYICGATRGDGGNHGVNYACVMSRTSTAIATNGTGTAYLTNIGVFGSMAIETLKAPESEGYKYYSCGSTINLDNIEICAKSTVFNGIGGTLSSTLELLNMKGVTDGVNDFGFISEFIINVGINPGNITIVEMCDVLTNLDVKSGPINCVKKDNSMQCVAYCELMSPVRPSSEIGMVKSEMKAVGAKNYNTLLNGSKGKKQKIISELMKKDRKTSRFSVLESQTGRATSNVDYTDMFITYDGVLLGLKLGGPHRLSCFYGTRESTFCNSTEGFGWVSGVELKPISGVSGQPMYVPDSYVYVTFTLEGQTCEGVLTDVTGALTCDTTCCITSFDDFETFIHVYAGTKIMPSGRLAISFIDQDLGRSTGSSSGKVYPQGVDEYYNSTCARGSDVSELWVCLRKYYPDVFWALMGTIIAFGVVAMILVVWRLGLKNTGKKVWSGTKKAGGWVASKSKTAAKWIANRVERANITIKISISGTLIETCKKILNNPESCTDADYNKVKMIKAKLDQKQKTWRSKMGAKKIGNNKYERVPKERGEERMSLAGLESYRMTLMDICSRAEDMGSEREKMSRLGKNISQAKDSIDRVKVESGKRNFKMR